MIADYTYYTDTYKGTAVKSSSEYEKLEKRAELEMGKYIDINAETYTDNEKMCCCSLVDIINAFNSVSDTATKGIKSESVSGYSVSYSDSNTIFIDMKKRIKEEIALWLGINTTYRGVGRHVL